MDIALYIILSIVAYSTMGGFTCYVACKSLDEEIDFSQTDDIAMFILCILSWPIIMFILLPAGHTYSFFAKLRKRREEEIEDVEPRQPDA